MAIILSDNIQTNASKPTDSRYYDNLLPYASVSAANIAIVGGVRYTGLTVNILGVEYWYGAGIADSCLVVKAANVSVPVTGATNLGSGNGTVYTSVSNKNIQLKSLSGGTNVTLTCNGSYIGINAIVSAGSITGLTDVVFTNPQNNDNLIYSGGTVINKTPFDLNGVISEGQFLGVLNGNLTGITNNFYTSAQTITAIDNKLGAYITGATNLGSGNGTIYTSVSGSKINLKTLSGGTNVTLSCNGNYIGINATVGTGFVWTGSTANGVGTYVNATHICSQPNMTFDGTALNITGVVCASSCIRSSLISGGTICGLTAVCGAIVCATTCFTGSGAGLTGTAASLTVGTATNANCLGGQLPMYYAIKADAITGVTNLGSGNGTIYTSVSANKIQLKTLSGGTNVTLTCNGNYIGINAVISAGSITGLTDVVFTNPQNNDNLIYSGGTVINKTPFDLNGVIGEGQFLGVLNGNLTGITNNFYTSAQTISAINNKLIAYITGATNLGSGNGTIYTSVSGNKINLKSLSGGTNITLTCSGNYIGVNAIISAGSITGLTDVVFTNPQNNDNLIYSGNTVINKTPFDLSDVITEGQLLGVLNGDLTGVTNNFYTCAQINNKLGAYVITGNSTNTGFTITHNKNSTSVMVEIMKNTSPYSTVYTSVSRPNVDCVCISFDTAPANGTQYKILIYG